MLFFFCVRQTGWAELTQPLSALLLFVIYELRKSTCTGASRKNQGGRCRIAIAVGT